MLCAAWGTPSQSVAVEFDPIGTWNCLVYGPYADQRMFLALTEDRRVYIARIRDASERRWVPLSDWRSSRKRITFTDPVASREFVADTGGKTLGGTWRSGASVGGWWCSPVEAAPVHAHARPPSPAGLMTELVPAVMQSPNYPRQAIREAREGQAVSCFFVNGIGDVSHAELLELSDEIFRGPILLAVVQSKYREWGEATALRPVCRNFTFELYSAR